MTTPFPNYVNSLATSTSVSSSDVLYLLQSGASKNTAVGTVGTQVLTSFPNYVSGLPAATTVNPGDLLYLQQSGVGKTATKSQIAGLITPAPNNWFVDNINGSDSFTGLSSAAAFKTLKHLLTTATQYNYTGVSQLNINVAPSSTPYNEGRVDWPVLVGAIFVFVSSYPSDPTTCTITSNTDTWVLQNPTPYQYEGFSLISTNGAAFSATGPQTNPLFDICRWSANADGCLFSANGAGPEIFNQHHILSGNNSTAFLRSIGANATINGATITVDAAWSPSLGFIEIQEYGTVGWNNTTVVNASNVTGPKFSLSGYSIWGGDTVLQNLPGTIAGSNAAPGCSVLTGNLGSTIVNGRDAPTVKSSVVAGNTVTAYSGQKGALITSSATIATLTVNLPSLMFDAEVFRIYTSQAITTLTIASTDGSAISGAPSTLAAGKYVELTFNAASTTWYAG
jgi:hypothetical protein